MKARDRVFQAERERMAKNMTAMFNAINKQSLWLRVKVSVAVIFGKLSFMTMKGFKP